MARTIEKGATYLDKLCHKLYDEPKGRGFRVDGKCCRCGGPLMTYYCEDRLHLIVCEKCGTLALTKAVAPQVAANLTLGQPTLTPPNEWVSVGKALPPEHETVLCIVSGKPKSNITLEDAYQLGSWNKADGWIIDEWLDWEGANVTWWMKLPESPDRRPPEGKEGGADRG